VTTSTKKKERKRVMQGEPTVIKKTTQGKGNKKEKAAIQVRFGE